MWRSDNLSGTNQQFTVEDYLGRLINDMQDLKKKHFTLDWVTWNLIGMTVV